MRILVIGQGGREHAIVKSLRTSNKVTSIHVVPGNEGMGREAICHRMDWRDTEALIRLILSNEIDYVIIGPDDPAVEGLADKLRERGILVVGPDKRSAQLEGSKIFCKNFLMEAEVPTARFFEVSSVEQCLRVCSEFKPPFILKADGLAAGKGVFICQDQLALKNAAEDLFEKKLLGKAGEKALLEEYIPGWEMSYLIFTNGQDYQDLPVAQDHKRLLEGNKGPNTGGMGTYAPVALDANLQRQIKERILEPSLRLMQEKGFLYRGILFIGIMVNQNGPQVLEFNVRFGDPEAQVILPLLDVDLAEYFLHLSRGELLPIKHKSLHAACVILAAEGYPDKPQKGGFLNENIFAETAASYFIHAGTGRQANGQWIINGGRVLGAVGIGPNHGAAISKAYEQAHLLADENGKIPGLIYRRDIGASAREI